ncbi:MAG: hypothetical protein PHY93_20750, partial [Bacteriovorax sp.]|nr:hypothetical protein [Bacteriovorax sp.]
LHFIYLCSKARVSAKGIHLQFKIIQYKKTRIKYVGLTVKSPKTNSFIQLFGVSESSFNLALRKTFSEFLESTTFWKRELSVEESRSGMATHKNYEQCYQNAYEELIERDSFVMHLYASELKTTMLTSDDGIDFIKLQSIDPLLNVVLARGFKDEKQFISLGVSRSLDTALEKAKLEFIMLYNEAPDFLTDKKDVVENCLRPHYLSAQSLLMTRIMKRLINGGGEQTLTKIDHCEIHTGVQERFGQFVTLKLSGKNILNLKFGQLWENEYNAHLRILSERRLHVLPFLIHPLL